MAKTVEVNVAKTNIEAKLPTLKHEGDAGMDFYCLFDTLIYANTYKVVRTGITVELPSDYNAILKPKGGSDHLLGAGVIEHTYQGEILFKIFNPLGREKVFTRGDAVGQMILIPAVSPLPLEVAFDDIHEEETDRKDSGGIVDQRES